MAKKETFTSEELERQADALLSACRSSSSEVKGRHYPPGRQTGGRAARRLMADQ